MPSAGSWRFFQRLGANGLIVALLAIIACDAFPVVPGEVRGQAAVIANRLGIGQGEWIMFAPPDRVNHRVRAEVTLRDGRTIVHPLGGPEQASPWQRFVGHRRSEYVDNAIVFGRRHREVWEACADYLARQYAQQGGGVRQIRIVVELAHIPPPSPAPWPPRGAPLPFDDGEVVVRRKYR